MKKKQVSLVILILVLTAGLHALEVETMFKLGNLGLPKKPLSVTDSRFSGENFRFGGYILAEHDMQNGIRLDFACHRDDILKNYIYSRFSYTGDFFSVGAGPVLGFLNSKEAGLKPGIVTNFKLEWPGIVFINLELLNSMGNPFHRKGTYNQSSSQVSLGFYLRNVICSLNMVQREFFEDKTSTSTEYSKTIEYSFVTDIHQKNTPFRITIGLGYRQAEKVFTNTGSGDTITEKLNSLLLQTRGDFYIGQSFSLFADLTSSLFSFGNIEEVTGGTSTTEPLSFSGKLPGSYLFEASLGCRIKFL